MADIVLSVSQVNEYISRKMFSDPFLSRIKVVGEVTNLSLSSVGHAFFSLKDENAMIGCIMYEYAQHPDKDALQDGAKIEVGGRVSFYRKSASVQLVAETAAPHGIGELFARFERTRQKLSLEGLFDEAHKKALPYMALQIGVVTSPAGAVLHDIINVATRRFDGVQITVYPVQVQGQEAAADICQAIAYFNEEQHVQVIIVARGGGSFEDLSAFNEESVVRAVYGSRIPVVSAVGHETDYTLCDMAADLRAPTPSAAAELVVREKSAVSQMLEHYKQGFANTLADVVTSHQQRLNTMRSGISAYTLMLKLSQAETRIKADMARMISSMESILKTSALSLDNCRGLLASLNPRDVLQRGYAIVYDSGGRVVKSAKSAVGKLEIEFGDGRASVTGKG